MLAHGSPQGGRPTRVVVIGSNSFVGRALVKRLAADGIAMLGLGRSDVDLEAADAGVTLATMLRAEDSVVAVAAKAPCRNGQDLLANARMIATLEAAFRAQPVAHIVNVSSDAVYGDEAEPLTEASAAAPGSVHGAMHLARENVLRGLPIPLGVLRSTLIYGASDPHNGYGPNMFRRKANRGEPIMLFGKGEERRDHVAVEDVADLLFRMLTHRSTGVLNAASGAVHSFRAIAEDSVRLAGGAVPIEERPRSGPMPHNGYRPFDPAATFAAFPDFRYADLASGMARAQAEEFGRG